jgi:hypothetical protein
VLSESDKYILDKLLIIENRLVRLEQSVGGSAIADGMLEHFREQSSSTDAHVEQKIATEYFNMYDHLRKNGRS